MKTLSIYIPTYNRKNYLKKQLEFLFADAKEHLSEIEIIVSDNASDDGTQEMVEALRQEHEFTYYRNDSNLGIIANSYLTKKYSKGKFLWTVGDDDLLKPGIINKIFHIITEYPDINFIFFNHALMHSKTIEYGFSFPGVPKELCRGYMEDASEFVLKNFAIIEHPMINMTAKVVRRELRNRVQEVIPEGTLEAYGHDLIISLAAIKEGKAYFDPEISLWGNYVNASWHADIFFQSWYGTQRSILKLLYLGYTNQEIRYISRSMFEQNLFFGNMYRNKAETDLDMYHEFINFLWESTGYSPQLLENTEEVLELPFVDQIQEQSIIIYGAGKIGRAVYKECIEKQVEIVAWCDQNYEALSKSGLMVESPDRIKNEEYDYLVVAVGGHKNFMEIYTLLTGMGVDKDKIKQVFPTYKRRLINNSDESSSNTR